MLMNVSAYSRRTRSLVWSAVVLWSVAMLYALLMEGMRTYMPRGIAYATPFQWAQLLGTCGFLWLTLGFGATLLDKLLQGFRAFQRYWEAHCCIDRTQVGERSDAALVLSGATLVAALFRFVMADMLPWYRQLGVCLTPIAIVSLVCLLCDLSLRNSELPEKCIAVFQERVRFWGRIFLISSAGIGYTFLRIFTEAQ